MLVLYPCLCGITCQEVPYWCIHPMAVAVVCQHVARLFIAYVDIVQSFQCRGPATAAAAAVLPQCADISIRPEAEHRLDVVDGACVAAVGLHLGSSAVVCTEQRTEEVNLQVSVVCAILSHVPGIRMVAPAVGGLTVRDIRLIGTADGNGAASGDGATAQTRAGGDAGHCAATLLYGGIDPFVLSIVVHQHLTVVVLRQRGGYIDIQQSLQRR